MANNGETLAVMLESDVDATKVLRGLIEGPETEELNVRADLVGFLVQRGGIDFTVKDGEPTILDSLLKATYSVAYPDLVRLVRMAQGAVLAKRYSSGDMFGI